MLFLKIHYFLLLLLLFGWLLLLLFGSIYFNNSFKDTTNFTILNLQIDMSLITKK